MVEHSLLHLVQKMLTNPSDFNRTIFVGFDPWAKAACVCALPAHSVTTWEQLERRVDSLFLFQESARLAVVDIESLNQKEHAVLKKMQDPLVLFTKEVVTKEDVHGFSSYTLSKVKPWEIVPHLQQVVRQFWASSGVAPHEGAALCLAETLFHTPDFFATEMEKYRCFSHEASFSHDDVEILLSHERVPSLWKLFDAFILGDKAAVFTYIGALEESRDVHPLQVIRFFRTQWEKMLLSSESGVVPAFSGQRQKLEAFRRKSFQEKQKVLKHLLLYDKKLREGEVEEGEALFPLFLMLLA